MDENLSIQNRLFGKTFFWMFLGLLGSGILAWYTYSSGLFINILDGGYFNVLLLIELVVVFIFSLLFRKLPPFVVGILYFIYSMLNGVTLSIIFVVFELNSILYLFVISALVFATLGFIGYKTNKDLTSFGTYLSVFLIAGILLSVVNLFILKNTFFELILDWFILILFFAITVYDINKIRLLQEDSSIDTEKAHIYCAMQLYLDFINIFLRILSILGKRKK